MPTYNGKDIAQLTSEELDLAKWDLQGRIDAFKIRVAQMSVDKLKKLSPQPSINPVLTELLQSVNAEIENRKSQQVNL